MHLPLLRFAQHFSFPMPSRSLIWCLENGVHNNRHVMSAWNLLISQPDEPEITMADFMTVLAASQKQAPTAAQGKALAGLLPEGLFETVLSAQIGATEAGAAAMPLALSEAFALNDKPSDRKPLLTTSLDTTEASAPPLVLPTPPTIPLAVAEVAVKTQSAASEPDEVEPVLSPRLVRGHQAKLTAEMAATPAASGVGQRQELPLPQQVLAVASAQAAISGEVVAASSSSPGLIGPAVDSGKPLDATVAAATRQFIQFEQLARTADTTTRATVDVPLRSQGFATAFSEKIIWLVGRQAQVADLSLNPPQLGALEVRLSLSGGEAGAQFYSPNPLVREAIEAALPKLRELMAQAGIALGDAQVRDEAFSRGEAGDGSRTGNRSGAASDTATISLAATAGGAMRGGLGLVDLYV
jgi:flagellar hook-length control protein FliK